MVTPVSPLPGKAECESSLRNVQDALYVLSGKWKLPAILTLMRGPRRFNELQGELETISPKVLARELKDLELNGFVRRTVFPTTPVSVVYEATDYSYTLSSVLRELGRWGGQHRDRIRHSLHQPEEKADAANSR